MVPDVKAARRGSPLVEGF